MNWVYNPAPTLEKDWCNVHCPILKSCTGEHPKHSECITSKAPFFQYFRIINQWVSPHKSNKHQYEPSSNSYAWSFPFCTPWAPRDGYKFWRMEWILKMEWILEGWNVFIEVHKCETLNTKSSRIQLHHCNDLLFIYGLYIVPEHGYLSEKYVSCQVWRVLAQ